MLFRSDNFFDLGGHSLLAVMDNSPPNITYGESAASAGYWVNFFKNLPYWLHDFWQLNPAEMVARLRRKLRILRHRSVSRGRSSPDPTPADIEAIVDIDLSQIPARHHHLLQAHYRARAIYQPRPYAGKVTLFRTRRHSLFGPFDPEMGWGGLARGGLEIKEIEGFHANILQEPYVQLLAQQLKACLDQAQNNAPPADIG